MKRMGLSVLCGRFCRHSLTRRLAFYGADMTGEIISEVIAW
jgi:hypothetical protein